MNIGTTIKSAAVSVAITFAASQAAADTEHNVQDYTLTDIRGMAFCEFLLITDTEVVIYNTSASPACPLDIFATLDAGAIAKEHVAKVAQLNGPKYWAMDSQVLGFGETKTFGGIEAKYAATLPIASLGSGEGSDPYAPYVTDKAQTMTFDAGKPVYELVDSSGNAFVMNAFGAGVENGDPANLAHQLKPAEGWTFRVRTLTEDLVLVQEGGKLSKMVGDDMHQYYSLETGGS